MTGIGFGHSQRGAVAVAGGLPFRGELAQMCLLTHLRGLREFNKSRTTTRGELRQYICLWHDEDALPELERALEALERYGFITVNGDQVTLA